jgi:hypothetical protein
MFVLPRLNQEFVMAGLVPGIHVFVSTPPFKAWMPATSASEATPMRGHDAG